MSSPKPESGVGKQYSTRNQPPKEYNVQRLQNLAENGGKISSAKIKAVNEQVSYVQPKTSEKANAHASDQSQEVQPQSKPQYSPQDGQPSSDDSNEAAPLEPNDIDMGDTEPERELSEPPNPKMANNGMNSSSSAPVNVNDQSDDEVLVDLKKLSIGRDQDGEPDAWSRLGRSLVLLVRYGPYKAAKYRVQTANGYNTKDMQKVSDLETRISHVTYRGQDGEKHMRYTRNNIVGIVGVAIQERKVSTKEYKAAPTAYIKVKWQDIDEADQKLLTRNTCWITNSDLVKLTDRATAGQKISDAWEKQEQRYNHWQGQMGRDSPDRSPSPCPLDTFKAEKDRTVKRESTRLATQELLPSSEHGPAARNTYLEPVPTERALGKRPEAITEEPSFSGPIKQEMDSENELFVPNEVSVNDSTYASKLAPQGEQPSSSTQVVTYSIQTYFEDKARKRGWDWDKMSAMERERKEDELLASYRFYKDQMQILGGVEVAI
ncbi:hypothetical protein N7455_006040 [Penicillium solitum]|uniref:Uncharacterized protein n=1 Tax=Penicillium thymicola TaxID=293382 RepID=A0AAI9X1Z1_PENTH|nr:hypothetical protein CBS147318_5423 [Penicillium roqueforti]KAJ5855225.1 hypothetical protein N7455_009173 [Penicillium solitum]KAJ9481001.1 hypothetical protein VN97_g12510 [Penicillium thymicola]KAI2740577.1 hypothetical protein DTO013F2_9048 [Penicillium roqueforti]KAI3162547.1 hypothetical protein DTO039G3_7930 [Penicillium roqueforti]